MNESSPFLADLRARITAIEGPKPIESVLFPLGSAALDAQLGGGLPKGRVHELFAAEPDDRAALEIVGRWQADPALSALHADLAGLHKGQGQARNLCTIFRQHLAHQWGTTRGARRRQSLRACCCTAERAGAGVMASAISFITAGEKG